MAGPVDRCDNRGRPRARASGWPPSSRPLSRARAGTRPPACPSPSAARRTPQTKNKHKRTESQSVQRV
eukprot:15131899-Heterocapsa_arctica.AAC.1